MARLFVISDIHGCLDHFQQLLKKINYKPNVDEIILLGDYIDRGPKSKEVVELVMNMVRNENVIALRGNHDQRFLDLIETKDPNLFKEFLKYGGIETLESYYPKYKYESIENIVDYIKCEYQTHIQFLKNTLIYHENEHFIFVHGGLNPNYQNWREQPILDFLNIREKFIYQKTQVDKIVIFGHTITSKIHHSADIYFSKDKIGIDGGCAFKQQLNCLEIIDKTKFKQHCILCS